MLSQRIQGPSKSLAMLFRGTAPFGGGLHSPALVTHKVFSDASRNHQAGSLDVCFCWHTGLLLTAAGNTDLRSWFGGMSGPPSTDPNDCVLQEVMRGKHLLEQKAKPHLSILRALQASNLLLGRCVLTAFRVCLLNPLSGLLGARLGFHREMDDMAGNTLPGSHSRSLLSFRKVDSTLNSVITTVLGTAGSC